MSGVFKKFRKGDIEITPFQANKEYLIYVTNYTGSYYEKGYEQSVIKDFTPTASAQGTDIRIVSLSAFAYDSEFDDTDFRNHEFGPYLSQSFTSPHSVTTNGHFKRSIHDSLQGMYYTNPDDPTQTLDNNGYEKEVRSLGKTSQVLSIPQSIFGESIKKGSVKIHREASPTKTLVDDSNGNLIDVTQFITAASESVAYASRSMFSMDFTKDLYNRHNKTINAHSINALASSSFYRDNGKEFFDLSNKTRFFERSGYPNRVEAYNLSVLPHPTEVTVVSLDGATPATTHSRTIAESQSIMIVKNGPQFDFRHDDDYSVYIRVSASAEHSADGAIAGANRKGDNMQSLISKYDPHGRGGCPFDIGYTNRGHASPGFYSARVSNGIDTIEFVSNVATGGDIQSLLLVKSGNTYTFRVNNNLAGTVAQTLNPVGSIHNNGDVIIGARAHDAGKYRFDSSTKYGRKRQPIIEYQGHARSTVTHCMIFSQSLSSTERTFLLSNPFFENKVGNVFYNHGLITVTNEGSAYAGILKECTASLNNTHTIIEHEYNCHVKEREYGFTMNPTIVSQSKYGIVKSFTTGSEWSPYVTTIGLYDDNARLVAVGKLSRPIRKSNEYDTTFVVSFDT
jgi:hypothetical protein